MNLKAWQLETIQNKAQKEIILKKMNKTLVIYMAPTTHTKKVGKYGVKVVHKRNYDRLWR